MSSALDLIAAERQRQIEVEGYTPEHDREHGPVVLQQAARCYERGSRDGMWPWPAKSFKPKGIVINLIRAGALYQAAIDVCANDDRYVEYLRQQRSAVASRIDEILADVALVLGASDD